MSQAVEDGDTVHLAGITADDKTAPIEVQTRQVLDKIDGYLAAAGSDRTGLLSALILVADTAHKPKLNEVWQGWIDPENPPARACVGVQFEGQTNVEIIIVARRENAMAIKRHDVGPIMSKAVEDGDTVYLAGLTADDPSKDIKGQTQEVLDKIDSYLAAAGTDKSKLLSALIFVSDIGLRPQMNELWNAWLDPGNPPTRACVGVQFEGNTLVEIIVVARK